MLKKLASDALGLSDIGKIIGPEDYDKTDSDDAVAVLNNSRTNGTQLADQYKQLTEYGFSWLTSIKEQYHKKDFGDVFEKYINN
ncbi:YvbH-like oligomerization domain-containing protein [Ornithinibacillus californiensis]|uniref:YvbH-like oligomerization domain-containing protein n=1 Tax=Ornithinibacillus californiensis TaxID=161536 RepID=UPI00064E0177|nr:YvbH-like oligomerization domain-containing protein [Ornithinibacillus californiensis]